MGSTIYSRESGSQFPDSLLDLPEFKDIDDSVKDIIMQYYQFLASNNIDSAIALLEANKTKLKPYMPTATILNLIKEEIQNIGIYAQLKKSVVISDTEPDLDYDEDSEWLQEIKE